MHTGNNDFPRSKNVINLINFFSTELLPSISFYSTFLSSDCGTHNIFMAWSFLIWKSNNRMRQYKRRADECVTVIRVMYRSTQQYCNSTLV